MRFLLVAMCLVALLGLACGDDDDSQGDSSPTATNSSSGGDSGDQAEIEVLVRTYYDHYINVEIAEIYPLLDSESQQNCPEDKFLSVLSDVRGAVGDHEIEFLEFTDVSIDGDHATVISKLRLDEVTDTTDNLLVKEDGVWKIQIRPSVCQG